jgi:hypothetical protein
MAGIALIAATSTAGAPVATGPGAIAQTPAAALAPIQQSVDGSRRMAVQERDA